MRGGLRGRSPECAGRAQTAGAVEGLAASERPAGPGEAAPEGGLEACAGGARG